VHVIVCLSVHPSIDLYVLFCVSLRCAGCLCVCRHALLLLSSPLLTFLRWPTLPSVGGWDDAHTHTHRMRPQLPPPPPVTVASKHRLPGVACHEGAWLPSPACVEGLDRRCGLACAACMTRTTNQVRVSPHVTPQHSTTQHNPTQPRRAALNTTPHTTGTLRCGRCACGVWLLFGCVLWHVTCGCGANRAAVQCGLDARNGDSSGALHVCVSGQACDMAHDSGGCCACCFFCSWWCLSMFGRFVAPSCTVQGGVQCYVKGSSGQNIDTMFFAAHETAEDDTVCLGRAVTCYAASCVFCVVSCACAGGLFVATVLGGVECTPSHAGLPLVPMLFASHNG